MAQLSGYRPSVIHMLPQLVSLDNSGIQSYAPSDEARDAAKMLLMCCKYIIVLQL